MSDCLESKKIFMSKTLKSLPASSESEYLICEQREVVKKKVFFTTRISFTPVLDVVDQGGTYPIVASLYNYPERVEGRELKPINYFLEIASKPLSQDPKGKYIVKSIPLDDDIANKTIRTHLTQIYVRVIARCALNYNRIVRVAFKYKLDQVRKDWGNVRLRQRSMPADGDSS
jgi:hypothetical protein